MAAPQLDVSNQIVAFKRKLAPRREALQRAYDEVRDHVRRAVERIREDVDAGRSVVPELDYRDIRNNAVPDATRKRIRSTGCAVVRGMPSGEILRQTLVTPEANPSHLMARNVVSPPSSGQSTTELASIIERL